METNNNFKNEGKFKPYKKPSSFEETNTFNAEGKFNQYEKPEFSESYKHFQENQYRPTKQKWNPETFSWDTE